MSLSVDLFRSIQGLISRSVAKIDKRIDALEGVRVRDMTAAEKAEVVDALKSSMQSYHDAWAIGFERSAMQVMLKAIAEIPEPKDGADFSDVEFEYDGERSLTIKGKGGVIVKRLPIPIDRGYWREGKAVENADIVTHDGNAWIAIRDNKSKPCHENAEDWRLFARKGRDGRHGQDGKPPPGPVKLGKSDD